MTDRIPTNLDELDRALGGGLVPGTLTMVVGATGVGKTQLGMHFIHPPNAGQQRQGTIIDLSSRGDSQNHQGYSGRMFDRPLSVAGAEGGEDLEKESADPPPDILQFLGYSGRRVLRDQMDTDQWHSWQSELNRRMPSLFRFVYSHLTHGTRRFLIDGIEPQKASSDSLQMELIEMIYHRMLRKEYDWLAREVYRESFRRLESKVHENAYNYDEAAAMVLVTTKSSMLEQLITEPLDDGDLAAGANTVIFMGRVLQDGKMQRGMYVAKHRGSYADQSIFRFDINEQGIQFNS